MPNFNFNKIKPGAHIHFIGIGGISMSGLAEILKNEGYIITGSDINESSITDKLKKDNIKIYINHNGENIKNADLVIYTAAVNASNPEIKAAKKLKIPIMERSVLLGEIMKKYKYPIAVAGSHGKTTTTSMVSNIFIQADTDPTVLVGGELDSIGGNVRIGSNQYFITEACEYVESFLNFNPYIGIILNIEEDHLDYYRNLKHIIHSFGKFGKLIPPDGYLIICDDQINVFKAVKNLKCNILSYGINNDNILFKAEKITLDQFGNPSFNFTYKDKALCTIKLSVPGAHNIYNALAAATCAYTLGISKEHIIKGLNSFKGTHRRFETKGSINGITIIDDYAHHPTEIKATLDTASKMPHNNIWCIFQPHTYTRTHALLDEFSEAFCAADKVIITDIYAAREKDPGIIHSKDLVKKMNNKGYEAIYISDFKDIEEYLLKHITTGDIIITMGAGNIFKLGEEMLLHGKDMVG